MSSFWNDHLDDTLTAIASSSPTPGGGAASALSAVVGLSLLRMAVVVSENAASGSDTSALTGVDVSLAKIGIELKQAAFADMAAFNSYMAAIKLPKGSIELDNQRNEAIDQAVEAAVHTPLLTAKLIVSALDTAVRVLPVIKASILSDLLAGATILHAACVAVQLNVDVNTQSKRLAPRKEFFQQQKTAFAIECEKLVGTIRAFGVKHGYRFEATDPVA